MVFEFFWSYKLSSNLDHDGYILNKRKVIMMIVVVNAGETLFAYVVATSAK